MKHKVVKATPLDEIALGSAGFAPCPGDGCNTDQGGCPHDAGCGQDC